ncbi:hypothetical protein ILYODFUR_026184 [Ilyodon furcidens]|uniref:Uncharacterized protein n=1 Tax=Ilyodon furcidens TaxID=33524 RepID=A0ABV0UWK1_9TELE
MLLHLPVFEARERILTSPPPSVAPLSRSLSSYPTRQSALGRDTPGDQLAAVGVLIKMISFTNNQISQNVSSGLQTTNNPIFPPSRCAFLSPCFGLFLVPISASFSLCLFFPFCAPCYWKMSSCCSSFACWQLCCLLILIYIFYCFQSFSVFSLSLLHLKGF